MNFELKLRFLSKFESQRSWILRDFVLTNTNSSAHRRGQGVHHTDLQTLLFNLGDMHKPTPKIEDVMEFPNGLCAE
jgi:hypothetical protein